MTLIAAWITPEFKIIASDSRLLDKDGNIFDEECKKIFATESFAIGLYGGFGLAFNIFKKQNLLNGKMKYENWDEVIFLNELKKYLKNIAPEKSEKKLESYLLFVPINKEPFIVFINQNNEIDQLSFQEYKDFYQLDELGDLFFSDHELEDGTTDFIHQKELLKHFNDLKDDEKSSGIVDDPFEVNLLIKLLKNITNPDFELINRKSIGGNIITYAYLYNKEEWQVKEFHLAKTLPFKENQMDLNDIVHLLKLKGYA
jgi:hypothetical protein